MQEGIGEVPEFKPETGQVDSAKTEVDPVAQKRAESAMQKAAELHIDESFASDDQVADNDMGDDYSRLEEKSKKYGGVVKAVTPIAVAGAAIGAVELVTNVNIDDGAYLAGLKEKTPDVYQRVIENRTIEAVGQENWAKMSAEERGKALAEMNNKAEEAIKEYKEELEEKPSVTYNEQTGQIDQVNLGKDEEGNSMGTYRVDLPS